MKKYILLLCSALAWSISIQAQNKPAKPEAERMAQLSRELSVNPAKAKEIAQALDYNTAEIRAVARNSSLSTSERQKQITALQAQRKAKIATVLTADQLQKLRAHQQPQLDARRSQREQKLKEQHQKLNKKTKAGRDSVLDNPSSIK